MDIDRSGNLNFINRWLQKRKYQIFAKQYEDSRKYGQG